MELTREEIREKIGSCENEDKYLPFNMSGYGSDGDRSYPGNKECSLHNFNLIKNNFPKIFWDLEWDEFKLQSWKGSIWWGTSKFQDLEIQYDFTGWSTEDIIFWLQKNKPYTKKEMFRIIDREQRYEVLKRQKWKCNQCGCQLKYSKSSSWKGEVAHIDHIHPFSKKESYENGIQNINELQNLQALCPICNKSKSNKLVH